MDHVNPHSDFYHTLSGWRAQEETDEEAAPTEENMSDSEDEYEW